MKHLLIAALIQGVLVTSAFAQLKTLPDVLMHVCGPEQNASS
ncbi:hypothetical protein [Piscinibacter gummiphilus]|nr:hypothetical protein [Piscinibacter gummiphilus]